ncbi:MAG: LexA family protein [Pikeienuella sp.]
MTKGEEFRELLRAAVAKHGVGERRFEQDHGLPKWSLRGILDPNRNQTPNLDKAEEICLGLGWQLSFKVAKAFDETRLLPVRGWAKCGVEGWGAPDQQPAPAPAPTGWGQFGFYARAMGHSMRPEGIASGAYALIDEARQPQIGDRVWVEDFQGRASLKRLIADDGQTIILRGWLDPNDGEQTSVEINMIRKYVRALHPVDRVFTGPPGKGEGPEETPDPKPAQQIPPAVSESPPEPVPTDPKDIEERLRRIEEKLDKLLNLQGA